MLVATRRDSSTRRCTAGKGREKFSAKLVGKILQYLPRTQSSRGLVYVHAFLLYQLSQSIATVNSLFIWYSTNNFGSTKKAFRICALSFGSLRRPAFQLSVPAQMADAPLHSQIHCPKCASTETGQYPQNFRSSASTSKGSISKTRSTLICCVALGFDRSTGKNNFPSWRDRSVKCPVSLV